jgi:uncharacterized damage-inducible protein DinB
VSENEQTRQRLVIESQPAAAPEVGRWLGLLADTRQRTLRALEGVEQDELDWPVPHGNAIGTLLPHIAAIEMDWLFSEILERDIPDEVLALLPPDVRDEQGNLWVVTGLPREEHLRRLAETRAILVAELQRLTLDDFYRARRLAAYDVTPEWVVHHLCQHEAEHRADIGMARTLHAAVGR